MHSNSLVFFLDCPTECTPEKKEAAQMKHVIFYLVNNNVQYVSVELQYIYTP